jgi:DNA-binding NarL/FixJ family response regulator
MRWEQLTRREKEVARHVAQGKANKVIARDIVPPMEPRTVETHRAHIFAKLGLANSNELDRFMRDNGL